MSLRDLQVLSIGCKVLNRNDAHVRFNLYSAVAPASRDLPIWNVERGLCGTLTMQTTEFNAFVARLYHDPSSHIDVYDEGHPSHPCDFDQPGMNRYARQPRTND